MENQRNERSPQAGTLLTLRLLETFLSVVQEGNMSAAAEKLGLSQAAVSQAIAALEAALSIKIFDRSVRPPALTLAGRTAHSYAAEIATKMRELERLSQGVAGRKLPMLRIGILNSFATTGGAFVLDQLRGLVDEWTVVSGFKATSYQALMDRTSDLIITSDESQPPNVVHVLPFYSEPFMIAVPSAYRGKTSDIRLLAQELDFIRYGQSVHMSRSVNGYLEATGAVPTRRYQFDTTDAALHMVTGGFGWALVTPLILLKSSSMLDAIRVVPLKDTRIRRQLAVAVRKDDGEEIAARILEACAITMKEVIIPQIARLVPSATADVKLEHAGIEASG